VGKRLNRRMRGEGTVFWHEGKQLYVARWQGREVAAKTESALQAKLEKLRADAGTYDERQTVGDYLRWWTDVHLRQRLRLGKITPATWSQYEEKVRNHLAPTRRDGGVGDLRLSALTAQHVDALMVAKLDAGLSPQSVRLIHATLRNALNVAAKQRLLARPTAAELAEPPTPRPPRIEPLAPEHARAVMAALANDRFEAFYKLAMALGLRISEAIAVHWGDLDLEDESIWLRWGLTYVRGEWVWTDTKSHRDDRLALPSFVVEALQRHRARQAQERLAAGPAWWSGWDEHDLCFTRHDGHPLNPTQMSRHARRLCERAGVPSMSFHQLARHGCATLLRQQGATPEEIKDLLRHTRITTTQMYAHITPELRRQTADRMDDLLGGADVPTSR
jgi:integrase